VKGETYTFKPCRKCGDAERYVATRRCPTCNKAHANKRNAKEEVKIRNKDYYKKYAHTEKGKKVIKKAAKKHRDLKAYGTFQDADKTKRRRDLEDLLLTKESKLL